MSFNDEMKAQAAADQQAASNPAPDRSVSDPHADGHQEQGLVAAGKKLWRELGLCAHELEQIADYIRLLGVRAEYAAAWLKDKSAEEATTFEQFLVELKVAFVLLRADVALLPEELDALTAFRGSVAWDQIDEFEAYLKDMGAQTYMDFSAMMKMLDERFPVNGAVDGVPSRTKNPSLLRVAPAPVLPCPPAAEANLAGADPIFPGAASPSSEPPATCTQALDADSAAAPASPSSPPPPPVNAPESPAADAPAVEAAAPLAEVTAADPEMGL